MADKRIITPADGMIILPRGVLNQLKTASAEELRLLTYMFAEPESDLAAAARETGMTVAQAESAYSFWRGAGIIEEGSVKKQVAKDASMYRNYDSETISELRDSDPDFRMVCDFAGEKLEKMLTKNDYSTLLYLYDFVRMPAPVICGVIALCCGEGKNSLQYIYKKTVALYENGIDTYEKFESYLARREAINSDIGKLRKLCGLGDRELSTKEKTMFDSWFGEWRLPFELVRLAFEKTVDAKGKVVFPYMNSILRSWYENGYASVEDVAKGEASRKQDGSASFTGDDFIEAAMNRGFDQ